MSHNDYRLWQSREILFRQTFPTAQNPGTHIPQVSRSLPNNGIIQMFKERGVLFINTVDHPGAAAPAADAYPNFLIHCLVSQNFQMCRKNGGFFGILDGCKTMTQLTEFLLCCSAGILIMCQFSVGILGLST